MMENHRRRRMTTIMKIKERAETKQEISTFADVARQMQEEKYDVQTDPVAPFSTWSDDEGPVGEKAVGMLCERLDQVLALEDDIVIRTQTTKSGYEMTEAEIKGEEQEVLARQRKKNFVEKKYRVLTKAEKSKLRSKLRDMSPISRADYILENGINPKSSLKPSVRDEIEKAFAKSKHAKKKRKRGKRNRIEFATSEADCPAPVLMSALGDESPERREIESKEDEIKENNPDVVVLDPLVEAKGEELRDNLRPPVEIKHFEDEMGKIVLDPNIYLDKTASIANRIGRLPKLGNSFMTRDFDKVNERRKYMFLKYLNSRPTDLYALPCPERNHRRQDHESRKKLPYEMILSDCIFTRFVTKDGTIKTTAEDIDLQHVETRMKTKWFAQYIYAVQDEIEYNCNPEWLVLATGFNLCSEDEMRANAHTDFEIQYAKQYWTRLRFEHSLRNIRVESSPMRSFADKLWLKFKEAANSMMDLGRQALEWLENDTVMEIFRISVSSLCALRLIYKYRKDPETIMEVLTMLFLSVVPSENIMPMLRRAVSSISEFFRNAVNSELDFPQVISLTKSFLGSPVVNTMKNLVLAITSMKYFGKSTAGVIFKFLGTGKKMSVLDSLTEILGGIGDLFKFGKEIVYGAPISEALFSADPVAFHMDKINACLYYENLYYTGVKVEGKKSARELVAQLNESISTLEAFVKANPKMLRAMEAQRVVARGSEFRLKLKNVLEGGIRPTPFGVIVYGTPGVGKSIILPIIQHINAEVRGRTFSPQEVFTRCKTSQYWEGYDPYSHPVIHYSEIGNVNANIVKSKGDDLVSELTSLVDSLRFNCDMAFDGKGQTFAFPELVIGDTNTWDLNLKAATNNFAAGLRRFVMVELKVKEQFRLGQGIDSNKVLEELGEDRMAEAYTFKVWRAVPTGNETFDPEVFMEHDDVAGIYRFRDLMEGMMRAHITKTHRIRDLTLAGKVFKGYDMKGYIDWYFRQYRPWSLEGVQEAKDAIIMLAEHKGWKIKDVEEELKEIVCSVKDSWNDERVPIESDWRKLPASSAFKSIYWHLRMERHADEMFAAKLMAIDESVLSEVRGPVQQLHGRPVFIPAAALPRVQEAIANAEAGVLDPIVPRGGETFWQRAEARFGAFFDRITLPFVWWHDLLPLEWQFYPAPLFWFGCYYLFSLFWMLSLFVGFVPFIWFTLMWVYLTMCLGVLHIRQVFIDLRSTVFRAVVDPVVRTVFYVGFTVRVFCGMYLIYKAIQVLLFICRFMKEVMGPKEKGTSEGSDWKLESRYNDVLTKVEEKTEAGQSYVRVSNKLGDDLGWQNVMLVQNPPAHTGTAYELSKTAGNSVRKVEIMWEQDGKQLTAKTHIFGVASQVALINTHIFKETSNIISLRVFPAGKDSGKGRLSILKYDPHGPTSTVIEIAQDVCMIYLNKETFYNIRPMLFESVAFKNTRGYVKGNEVELQGPRKIGTLIINDRSSKPTYSIVRPIKYKLEDHQPGDCGRPVFATIGTHSGFVGIHTGGNEAGWGYAATVTKPEIERGILHFEEQQTFLVNSEAAMTFKVEMPRPKSMLHYVDISPHDYFGRDESCPSNPNQKSRLRKTPIFDVAPSWFEQFGLKQTKNFGVPMLMPQGKGESYINPINNGVVKMATETPGLDPDLMKFCEDRLFAQIVKGLKENGVTSLKPWDVQTAVNGAPHDEFVRRINMATSIGPGLSGNKGDYFPVVDDQVYVFREPLEVVKERVAEKVKLYDAEESNGARCRVALKDEPREIEKCLAGKTRLFYVGSIEDLIVARMYLGPFYSLMNEHSDNFNCAIGVNMHREADKIYNKMKNFSNNIIEGDYSGYDLKMPFLVKKAAANVIYRVLKEFGYNDDALRMVKGVLSDGLFPVLEILGDIMRVAGLQPSGKFATAEDNCIVNILLLMYAWYYIMLKNGLNWDFFDHCIPVAYGDDCLCAVSDEAAPYFNNHTYAQICEEMFGMGFTPAAKTGELQEFVTPDTMSFLKRKFVYHEDHARIVAPLDFDSILRSLMWTMPSNSVSTEDQLMGVVASVSREISFHLSRVDYTSLRSVFCSELPKYYAVEKSDVEKAFPQFDDLFSCPLSQFSSDAILGGEEEPEAEHCVSESEDLGLSYSNAVQSSSKCPILSRDDKPKARKYVRFANSEFRNKVEREILALEIELKEASEQLDATRCPFGFLDMVVARRSQEYANDPHYRKACEDYIYLWGRVESLRITIATLRRNMAKNEKLRGIMSEADVGEMSSGVVSDSKKEENLTIVDAETPDQEWNGEDVDFVRAAPEDLASFLMRPTEVYSGAIPLSTDYDNAFSIASTFFGLPSVRAKLKNYAFIRCTFNVRVMVSATPFHQGSLLVGPVPFIQNHQMASRQLGLAGLKRKAKLGYLSSMSHTKMLDVRKNIPLEFSWKWCHPQPIVRLFNTQTTVTTAAQNFSDWAGYLNLYVASLNQITSVSTSPSSVYLYVYTWLTDVQLAGLTATNVAITSEMDERKTGPVERWSSSMLGVSKMLEKVPMLKPYAMASSVVLGSVKNIAAHFGFSMPTLTTVPSKVRPDAYQSTAVTVGSDTSLILGLDQNIEVPIDGHVVSVDEDEMAIAAIARKESLLYTTEWKESSSSMVPLTTFAVNPRCVELLQTTSFQMTNLGYVATPFLSWRGSIKYTFRIVCSQFHRGRIGIYYEPNISQLTLIGTNLDLNKNKMVFVDIAETQEFSVCVNWNAQRMYLLVNDNTRMKDSINIVAPINHAGYANGAIMIVPITQLQAPQDSSVFINTFISSENIEFNGFTDINMPSSFAYSESAVSEMDGMQAHTCFDISDANLNGSKAPLLHYGEKPLSFRALLKRFVGTSYYSGAALGGANVNTLTVTLPILPNLVPNIAGTNTTNSRATQLLGFLRNGFLGYKGGVRKKLRTVGNGSTAESRTSGISVSLVQPATTHSAFGLSTSAALKSAQPTGTVLFSPNTNSGIEVRLPYYSNNLFGWACNADEFTDVVGSVMEPTAFRDYTLDVDFVGTATLQVVEDSAVADDFSLLYYMGPPGYSG